MAKIGYLRPWWLWLGAFAALLSVLTIVTGRDDDRWIGAALVGVAVIVGGVLTRRMQAHFPVPERFVAARDNRAVNVGVAFGVAGFAIGMIASEYTDRGDYGIVAGIAAVWFPTVVLVMRRFASRVGRHAAESSTAIATALPLGRALPESLIGIPRPLVAGLAAGFVVLVVQWTWSVGPKRRQDARPPVVPV